MIGRKWLYYILDEMGRSYYVDNNVVKVSTVPTPLEYTPDGWQNIGISWQRNWNYYGVNRNVTNPLNYVKDGAYIMRYLFYNGNIETKAYLLIQERTVNLSSTEYSYTYEYFYKGENDFSTFTQVDINEGKKVTISIAEGGFTKYAKANSKNTYELPCNSTANNPIKVRMDGIAFEDSFNYSIPEFQTEKAFWAFTIPVAFINEEGDNYGLFTNNEPFSEIPQTDPDQLNNLKGNAGNFFGTILANQNTLAGNLSFRQDDGVNINCTIAFRSSLGTTYPLITNEWVPHATIKNIPFNFTVNLQPNENLFLIANCYGIALGQPVRANLHFFQTDFKISTTSKVPETICICRRSKDVFQELLDDMCGVGYTANSTLLDANKSYVLTTGKALRGFDDAVLKTTFDDFFKSMRILNMAGLNYDDNNKTVEIETIAKYFDASNPIFLGTVKNVKPAAFTDQSFNSLNIGYNDQNYDSVNGLKEFNTTEQYSTIITRISKILDMVLPYRADSYGADILRKDYQNLETTDSSSDDDIWLLDIEDTPDQDGIYNLRRPPYSAITGVTLDQNGKYTAYNTRLSPKNILLNNGALLHSLLYGFDNTDLTFQTTDKNPLLSTTLDGKTVTEAANQNIGSLAPMLFKPLTFDIDPEPFKGLTNLLDADTNRCFSFEYNGNIYKGFNIKVAVAPNDNQTQTFQLLSTADNDLTKLIQE